MSIVKLIEPGDAVSAADVSLNFSQFATDLSDVHSDKIEDNSIRTRHIATGQGTWKEITVYVNTDVTSVDEGDGLTVLVPQTASTETVTQTGQMVLVIARTQLQANGTIGTHDSNCTLRILVDMGSGLVDVRNVDIDVVSREKLEVSMLYAFEATADSHLIQFRVDGSGAYYTLTDYQLQIIAVRG